MIQRPFFSTTGAQPRDVTFLTTKTAIKTTQTTGSRSDGVLCLDKPVVAQGKGGGGCTKRVQQQHMTGIGIANMWYVRNQNSGDVVWVHTQGPWAPSVQPMLLFLTCRGIPTAQK